MSAAEPVAKSRSVSFDLICSRCGYNLRGKEAVAEVPPGRGFSCVCPECGNTQAFNDPAGLSNAGASASGPWLLLVGTVLTIVVVWMLIDRISVSTARLVTQSPEAMQVIPANPFTPSAASLASEDPTVLLIRHLLGQTIPILLCGIAVDALASQARFARGIARDCVAVGIVLVGFLLGCSRYASRDTFSGGGSVLDVMMLASQFNRSTPAKELELATVCTYLGGGLLMGLIGARIGVAIGRPIVDRLLTMYLSPERRRQLLSQ